MSKRLIIGFGHKARQGKDTAVQAILDYYDSERKLQTKFHGYPASPIAQRISFADELYRVCREEHGMKDKDPVLLQRVGAERRQQDSEYWIKRAFDKIDKATGLVLITDVRYQNEAEYIKKQGGFVTRVQRLIDGKPFISPDRPADHPSEIELDNYVFDFYLTNVNGHEALIGEQAITLAEYLRSLND